MRALVILLAVVALVVWLRGALRPRTGPRPAPAGDPENELDSPEILFDGSEELAALLSSPDPVAIDAYRGALHGIGIPTVVFDEATSRMLGRIPAVAMRIMVPRSRLEEARALVEDFEPGTFPDRDEA